VKRLAPSFIPVRPTSKGGGKRKVQQVVQRTSISLAVELEELADSYPGIAETLKLAATSLVDQHKLTMRIGELELEVSELRALLSTLKDQLSTMLQAVSEQGALEKNEKGLYDLMQGMMLDLLDSVKDLPAENGAAMVDDLKDSSPAAPSVEPTKPAAIQDLRPDSESVVESAAAGGSSFAAASTTTKVHPLAARNERAAAEARAAVTQVNKLKQQGKMKQA